SRAGQGGGAGGVVAAGSRQVNGQGCPGGKGVGAQPGGGGVEPLGGVLAQRGQGHRLAVGRAVPAGQYARQAAVQGDQAFAVPDPGSRGITPAGLAAAQLVAAPQRLQGGGKLPLLAQGVAQVGVGQGVLRGEADGLLAAGNGPVQLPFVQQGDPQ